MFEQIYRKYSYWYFLRRNHIKHCAKITCGLFLVILIILKIQKIIKLNNAIQETKFLLQRNDLRLHKDSVEIGKPLNIIEKHAAIIETLCSKNTVKLAINGDILYEHFDEKSGRGLHILIVDPKLFHLMGHQIFDTYTKSGDKNLNLFLEEMSKRNLLLIFATKDEASFSLGDKAKNGLKTLGSKSIDELKWRSLWSMIVFLKQGTGYLLGEKISHTDNLSSWPEPMNFRVIFNSSFDTNHEQTCKWSPDVQHRLETFCKKYVLYKELCSCKTDSSFFETARNFSENNVYNIPVVIIAANRPQYLYKMLRSLLSASGVNKNMITIFIDGFYQEPMDLSKVFGVKAIYHTPSGTRNARISQHYLSSISATFSRFPDSKYAIILEEDLQVSSDFFKYFSQTLWLLEKDPSIYCISAWNDQGYNHTSEDPTLLYRVETMPGLGWILKRSLFEEELEPIWPGPDKPWDWDMWMRHPDIRKGRECVIPDVSRTFHFGEVGINMNNNFYETYFKTRRLNQDENVVLKNVESMVKMEYEKLFHQLVRNSVLLNHTKSPCDADFVPKNSEKSYVAYFSTDKDAHTFIKIARCLKIWDLDVRGFHKHAFRTFIRKTKVVFIGYPQSAFGIYKPPHIVPIK